MQGVLSINIGILIKMCHGSAYKMQAGMSRRHVAETTHSKRTNEAAGHPQSVFVLPWIADAFPIIAILSNPYGNP